MVEIGTRNGDGIACFSSVASRATAVEINPPYCRKLEDRAKLLRSAGGQGFDVECRDYRQTRADAQADVYTWWQETPGLHDLQILRALRTKLDAGLVKKSLVAIFAVDPKYSDDQSNLAVLRNLGLAKEVEEVTHDEYAACRSAREPVLRKHPGICDRARGKFLFVRVPISVVNGSAVHDAMCKSVRCKERAWS